MERETYYEIPGGEDGYSVLESLRVLRRRWWVVALTTILLAGAGLGYSLLRTPTYEASIKILIGQEEGAAQPGTLGGDVQGLQQLTQTMAQAIDSRPVAQEVIRRLDLGISPEDFIEERLEVEQISTTQFIEVRYEDSDPERAQRVANTLGEVFSERVSGISASSGAVTATLWERADLPDDPVSPNLPLNIGAGAALGLLIGVALALLLEFFDHSWRSPEELELISGTPNFGAIPEFEALKGRQLSERVQDLEAAGHHVPASPETKPRRASKGEDGTLLFGSLVALLEPGSTASEAFRGLRTNLVYALVDEPPKVIMLTSPAPREGKSTVCANLGITLAQAGLKTLIVDCDLRKPAVHKIFGARNFLGLVNVLVRERDLQGVWHELAPNLRAVTTGPIPLNPSELLGSKRLSEVLDEAREEFDYVLLDAPPVGVVSDPTVLATRVDGVFLVVDAQSTRKRSVQRSMRSLETVGARVLGTVMNNVKLSRGDERYYAYAYR